VPSCRLRSRRRTGANESGVCQVSTARRPFPGGYSLATRSQQGSRLERRWKSPGNRRLPSTSRADWNTSGNDRSRESLPGARPGREGGSDTRARCSARRTPVRTLWRTGATFPSMSTKLRTLPGADPETAVAVIERVKFDRFHLVGHRERRTGGRRRLRGERCRHSLLSSSRSHEGRRWVRARHPDEWLRAPSRRSARSARTGIWRTPSARRSLCSSSVLTSASHEHRAGRARPPSAPA
jgi:hypothetical protein